MTIKEIQEEIIRLKKEKGSTDHEEVYHHRKCRCYGSNRSGSHHRQAQKVR